MDRIWKGLDSIVEVGVSQIGDGDVSVNALIKAMQVKVDLISKFGDLQRIEGLEEDTRRRIAILLDIVMKHISEGQRILIVTEITQEPELAEWVMD